MESKHVARARKRLAGVKMRMWVAYKVDERSDNEQATRKAEANKSGKRRQMCMRHACRILCLISRPPALTSYYPKVLKKGPLLQQKN